MPGSISTLLGEKMGNVGAKVGTGKGRRKRENSAERDEREQMEKRRAMMNLLGIDDDEEERLTGLRKLIKEKPNVFILNNLIMSIQLFSHYEKEIESARRKLIKRESALNEKLLPEKTVLMPDSLREHFDGRIRFTSYCKSDKDEQTVEPLRPIKIYMIYENVAVTELDESRHYSNHAELTVDYTFLLKEAELKGYVRLEQSSKPSLKRGSDNIDLSSIAENHDEIYSEDESVYGPINNHKGQNGNVSSKTVSMPDLLDENIYYEEGDDKRNLAQMNLDGTLGANPRAVAPPSNAKIPARHQRHAQFRPSNATNPYLSASSSSSGYTTTYGLDSDSDSSSMGAMRYRNGTTGRANNRHADLSEIPTKCFKRVTYMYNDRIYNHRKEQKPLTSQQRRIRDAKLAHNYDIVYVHGYRFARHFYDVFRQVLADKMDFDENSIKNAKRNDATIRLEKIDYLSSKNYISIEQYEVVPCFSSPWPKWARKWLSRSRGDWPNSENLRQVEKFDCYLVPDSQPTLNTDQEQPLWKLNWSLNFPQAERYLETCISASQMTVYAIALMLHKTVIKSVSTTFGLDTGHIRNTLFWMIERNPEWPESEMGKFMVILLESLHTRVQQRTMNDYFMHDRNLFTNVLTDDLLHSQKQLKRIIENPVMFIFHTMEKIQYENTDYPRLDYRELLRLLTLNELMLINPKLEMTTMDESTDNAVYGKRQPEKTFWTEAKQKNQFYMQTRKRNTQDTLINPKQMFDSIIDIQEKCEPLTNIRLAHLLMFFSRHFINMAKSCHRYSVPHQKHVYLEHTRLLALLLYCDNPDFQSTANGILEEVKLLRESAISAPLSFEGTNAPETPKRNVDPPIFQGTLKNRYGIYGQSTVPETDKPGTSNETVTTASVHQEDSSETKTSFHKRNTNEIVSSLSRKFENSVTMNTEVKSSFEATTF